jgi:pyridinium-3,5-bisthiocarboxylic acid mononucleotide nickel chelatase
MNTALFDIITGISGDMTIGALLDAGADFDNLKHEIAKLNLIGFDLILGRKMRSQINAAKFDVVINHQPHYHTHLGDINKLIDNSTLSDYVKLNSKKIFETVGIAEAKIHNIPLEKIHFHEVGAIDSIVDIVGTCSCIENLGIKEIYSTPVKLGKGLINTQHGVMPNPAPATLEILKDYPVEFTNIDFELTTPTGAAIIKTLSSGVYDNDRMGNIKIKNIGFGSGTFDIKESPNLLRIIICDTQNELQKEQLVQVETNIDDMNPQLYPFVMEKLFEAGAKDVFYHDVVMKKGRLGILLSVLTEESKLENIVNIIYRETTTIGVRINKVGRNKLEREIKEFDTSFGKVKAKVIIGNNSTGINKVMPEFEECRRIANDTNKPLNEIYNQLYRELNKKSD